MNRREFLKHASILSSTPLIGCLAEESRGRPEVIGNPDRTHVRIEMLGPPESRGMVYRPVITWITQGGLITWENTVPIHSTTAYHPENNRPNRIPEDAEPWDSGNLQEPGAEFQHEFDITGVYDYYCRPHEYQGMVGSIIVGNPDPEDEPGLSAPPRDFPAPLRQKLKMINEVTRQALRE